MSSYSDFYANIPNRVNSLELLEDKLHKKCFDKLQPKPIDSLINRNRKTLLLICFILIIIYSKVFLTYYSMMNNIYSKQEYFHEHLRIEKEKMNKYKQELEQLSEDLTLNLDINNSSCRRCYYLMVQLDFKHVSRVLDNNRHIKHEYDGILFPLQYFLILICFINTFCIIIIFKEPFGLFLTSNLFVILCLCIYGEVFIEYQSNLKYTIIIGLFICVFSVNLLFQIFKTLLTISYYQTMKNTLTSE